jgi:hypothetical protein
VFNWPQDHDRQKRVARFVDYLFERFPKLQTEAGYHPKWRELNLAATVPGWQRYAPMQNKLNALVTARTAPDIRTGLTEHLERILPGDAAAQERLLRDILEQRKSQSKQ